MTMASGDTTGTAQCPECHESVEFPVRARHRSRTEVEVSVDLDPVREHVASHAARYVTELPPTAR
ncbi:hypothetical protein CLM62_12790 [Streptomyces sp. SA15]|nr:hypothetical protein CLM62_12790 [Streptomyces sp. SA15]